MSACEPVILTHQDQIFIDSEEFNWKNVPVIKCEEEKVIITKAIQYAINTLGKLNIINSKNTPPPLQQSKLMGNCFLKLIFKD